MSHPDIIFIVGPTAVGKSDAAIELAARIGGEIVSCDSMQVYREIRIASNRPSESQMKQVPHHLIGVLSVTQDFNVKQYQTLALEAIGDILKRGKVPIVCGGSGLYAAALVDGIFEGEGPDVYLREQLLRDSLVHGAHHLHQRLKRLDPVAADAIHPNNVKRVIRAMEVCLHNKAPMSQLQRNRRGLADDYRVKTFGLRLERSELYDRINRRVGSMMDQGLVEEIRSLDPLVLSQTARFLIGVREIQEYLRGSCDRSEAVERIQLNTRHLAKRQMTWFSKDQRIEWIDVTTTDRVVGMMTASLSKGV